ncbi:MAG: hypothetical protein B7Y83_00370 [Flavobacteriales bacterium 32-34-25]|nr:MAG: hypothetical protein B7Y83_00370 [Flavobacteriales bacterium 32-34-25]
MEFLDYYISPNVDKINPIEFIKRKFIAYRISEIREKLFKENPIMTLGVDEDFFKENAEKDWEIYFENMLKIKVPESFVYLLKNKDLSKTQQKSILKKQSLSPIQMEALIIKAWNDFNYSYSYYHFDILKLKKENYKLPNIFHYNDEKLTKIGETNLSDTELKQIINQRNSRVIHFLDNGESWHCFFITYRSISGKETWSLQKPHYHYISEKWNIKRDEAIEQFKNENYPSTNVHIECNV